MLVRRHSQGFAHQLLLYPSLVSNAGSIPISYSHFSSLVCEILTSLSSLALSSQRAKHLFTCPDFEAFFPPQALSFGLILLIADASVELSVLQHAQHSHDSAGRPGLAIAIKAARVAKLPVVIASEDGQHAKS